MKRLLSLLPSATEIVYELGAEDALVGVTHECDYPAGALAKPRVTAAKIHPGMESGAIDALVREQLDDTGTLYSLDMDLVRELRPEIVLTQQLCTVCAVGYATVHAAMRSLPDPPEVVNLEPKNLDDVLDTIIHVADLIGMRDHGVARVEALRRRLEAIPPLDESPRVLFLEWLIPPFSGGHWMAELVERAGGRPVLANPGEYSRQLFWDTIRRAEFDVVVISCCGFSVERAMRDIEACGELHQLLDERPGARLILFDGNHFFSRPGPRLVETAELLHHALKGNAPADVASSVQQPYIELQRSATRRSPNVAPAIAITPAVPPLPSTDDARSAIRR